MAAIIIKHPAHGNDLRPVGRKKKCILSEGAGIGREIMR